MTDPRIPLILASASPSRLTLLTDAGVPATVRASGVDEEAIVNKLAGALGHSPNPSQLVSSLAQAKAVAVFGELQAELYGDSSGVPTGKRSQFSNYVLVAADSMLSWQGQILGKPGTAQRAISRWQQLRGTVGELYTGQCVITAAGDFNVDVSVSTLRFAEATDAQIEAYVALGDAPQVAGGFTLEGKGSAFVDRVEGDPTGVIGLSIPLLRRQLAQIGVDWLDVVSYGSSFL